MHEITADQLQNYTIMNTTNKMTPYKFKLWEQITSFQSQQIDSLLKYTYTYLLQ